MSQWFHHRSPRLGAALAYYTVFAMGPLLLIVTAVAGLFFGADLVRMSLSAQFRGLLGPTGSGAVESLLAGASARGSGVVAVALGVVFLILGAVGLLQHTPHPSEADIVSGMNGHICRCGTYSRVVQAVRIAAQTQATKGGRA